MCNWFSCISDGKGKVYFFNEEQRKKSREGTLVDKARNEYYPDSHSSITSFFNLNDDKVNKYEYRPLDKRFIIDQINAKDDRKKVLRRICQLDFSKLAPPELIIKPIIHPFKDKKRTRVTKKDLELLKKWASVGNSVWASVENSVRASVEDSVGDFVWASVEDSVGDSVGDFVRASVGDFVGAYVSSFFNLKKWKYIKHPEGKNPFQSGIDLWERGIVPAFGGKYWYLFGYKGKLLKKIKKSEL